VSAPVRTCVGCGAQAGQGELTRLVVEGARVVIDAARRRGGRGAWIHASPECLARAVKRRAIGRALRRPEAEVDAGALGVGLTGHARKH
jgi:predicted RNA-binding protein YlxR (DUF448 family)